MTDTFRLITLLITNNLHKLSVQQSHLHMTNLQLIRNNLISMFSVRLTQVLVQHDTVNTCPQYGNLDFI